MIAIQTRLIRPAVAWNSSQSTKRTTATTNNAWIISILLVNSGRRAFGKSRRRIGPGIGRIGENPEPRRCGRQVGLLVTPSNRGQRESNERKDEQDGA